MRPLPVTTYPALMVHDMTPPLSPTSSVGSTNSPETPVDAHTPTVADDGAVDECALEGRFALFKNSSEVWEEFNDVGCDPSNVTVADPGILISPSSSLLSGLDLLGGATPPPVPEVNAIPTPHNESFLDFPSPPALVSNGRTSFGQSRPIGKGSLMVSPLSHPGLAVSCDSIPQPTGYPQSSALRRRWSALPPSEFHPDNLGTSSERVATKRADPFRTRAAVANMDTPAVPRVVPFLAASHHSPGDGPSRRPPKRREKSDPFESFMDMSVTESALSTSRVHKLFSKISGGFKPRRKRHC